MLHIRLQEFTEMFTRDVGTVGKERANRGVGSAISNCPDVHRHVLEIGGICEGLEVEGVGRGFHFSEENDGDYWFCYLSEHRKT
jgi:hypothetical protein